MDPKDKIPFLTLAINDTQQLIKNIDTKLTVVLTILGAFIVTYFNKIDEIIYHSKELGHWWWLTMILFVYYLIRTIVLTAKILIPTQNPSLHINMGTASSPKVDFFLPTNNYANGDIHLFNDTIMCYLSKNYNDFINEVKNADGNDLIEALSYELLKLSYIRNLKYNRFKALIKSLSTTTILFFTTFIIFSLSIN